MFFIKTEKYFIEVVSIENYFSKDRWFTEENGYKITWKVIYSLVYVFL